MRDKIEVWPKILVLTILTGMPFMVSANKDFVWLLILFSAIQIYFLLINDERVFDIHKRLRELEKREENKTNLN